MTVSHSTESPAAAGAPAPGPEGQRGRTAIDHVWIAARGYAMGAADVVPGVSGGTMAFILGIYDELLNAIHAVDGAFLRRLLTLRWREALAHFPWRFLLALGLGIGLAIVTLAQGIDWALHNHPSLVWAFFFGLVLASVWVVRKRIQRWTPVILAFSGLAAVAAFILVGLTPAETPNAPWFLFISGAVAICAMILPGISGAFILVLLGKYQYVLNAVVQRDLVTLAIVAAGCVVGLLSFARALRWLLRRYHDATVAVLVGFMFGSLRKVWPWKSAAAGQAGVDPALAQEFNVLPPALTADVGLALALMALGFGLVLLIDLLASRQAAPASVVEQSP